MRLRQNYPNPFNPVTAIIFTVPESTTGDILSLQIYDIMGREIATLANDRFMPGEYTVYFDGTSYPTGVYFYRLILGNSILTQRMLLLK
jgi:hypothetical protein